MKYFNRAFCFCLLFSVLLVYGFLILGSFHSVTSSSAGNTELHINQTRNALQRSGYGWLSIFANNYAITLFTFAPLVGLAYMPLAQFNTGVVIAGLSRFVGISNLLYIFLLMIIPAGLLEYLCYVFCYAESLYLVFVLYKHPESVREQGGVLEWFKTHFVWTFLFCTAVLLLAAFVEWRFFL